MTSPSTWLPPLVLLVDYDGNWGSYLEAVYAIFRRDFVTSKPTYPGRRVGLKRHPIERGKEATFWHFISEGRREEDRLPDLRRCERIGWPRPMIEAVRTERVRCWQTRRRFETRVLIALEDFSYVVVLADRSEYILPWTAFTVEREHRRRILEREYDSWAKNS